MKAAAVVLWFGWMALGPAVAQSLPPPAREPAPAACAPAAVFGPALLLALNELRATGAVCGRPGRAAEALPPLVWSDALAAAARDRAADVMQRLVAGRSPEGGPDGGELARGAGYAWRIWREALGGNLSSPSAAMTTWAATPQACEALLSPRVTEVGVACASAPGASYRSVWSLISAAR